MVLSSFSIRMLKESETRLAAMCNITLDDMFAISDIKVIRNQDGGFFLAMPSKKKNNGLFKDVAFPVNSETRSALEDIIFSAVDAYFSKECSIVKGTNTSSKTTLFEQEISDFSIVCS